MTRRCATTCAILALVVLLSPGCNEAPEANDQERSDVLTWGGPGRIDGRFVKPRGITLSDDRLYIIDRSGRLQVFDLSGEHLTSWTLPLANRGYPIGLCGRADGAIAVAVTHDSCVKVFSTEGELLETVGKNGGGEGEFTFVTDVAFDSLGNMIVSEHGREDRIQKLDSEGRFLQAWGRGGSAPGEFHRPQGLLVDEADCIYVADSANHRVQKFSPEGKFLLEFGEFGSDPGEMKYPYDLAFGPGGSLLVCEYGNNRVEAFDREGRLLGSWGGPGRDRGELAAPWGVAFAPEKGIYVLNTENHRVEVFRNVEWVASTVSADRSEEDVSALADRSEAGMSALADK